MNTQFLIRNTHSLKTAFKKIALTGEKCLIVISKKKKFLGTLSDGDLRKAVLSGMQLTHKINDIYNNKAIFYYKYNITQSKIKEIFLKKKITIIPVLNIDDSVNSVLTWSKFFSDNYKSGRQFVKQVVVMAGGEGKRMRPLTNFLPKPMIPIGNKTLIERIIENFFKYQVKNILVTMNYKSKILKSFLDELNHKKNISYYNEKKVLGTVGCLSLMKKKLLNNFFLINCDTLLEIDLNDLGTFHIKNNNDLTIVTSAKTYKIPFGICNIGNNGNFNGITEKKEHNYLVNTGCYVFKKKIINIIEKNKKQDMNVLINNLIKKKYKVGVFTIDEKSWKDVGQWKEYLNLTI